VTPRPLKISLNIYVGILVLYGLLVGWWVYFFSQQDGLLVTRLEAAGVALDAAQAEALQEATSRTMRMFLFEGSFLGLLLFGSMVLVLRSLRHELALHREQQNFLAAVTHELRSPLASAKLYLETISMGRADPAKTDRYLQHATEDLDRLGGLVEDLLTARRMSTEGVKLDLENLDLAEVARTWVDRYQLHHDDARDRVELDAEGTAPTRADRAAMEQIIDNLVSNAVKYGGDQPQVRLAVNSDADGVCLEVRDHGPGLQGMQARDVLRPFVRGGEEDVRTHQGAGLGLYIVSEFVRAHGGELRLADANPGMSARVLLPRGVPQ
jgi:signal transduction histidine kinase